MARSFKTPITVDGVISTNNVIESTQSTGDEGGQINLAKAATNTTLTTGVTIDVYQNKLRFWETGGTNRGYFLDISAGGTGVTTNIIGTASAVSNTVTGTNSADLVYGNMADNDQFRIRVGGTATNAGFVEIATADDGTEPIYVRQYTGVFATLARTATILDGSGNTSFPGTVSATSFNSITGLSSTTPSASGTAAVGTATTAARADHVHPTTGLGLTSGTLAQFAATTSAQLLGVISDETGSGALVFGTSPSITTSLTTASASFDLINANATTVNFAGAATSLAIATSTANTTVNLATGATTGSKTVNIGTGGTSGSVAVTLGSSSGSSSVVTVNGTITGAPTAATAATAAGNLGYVGMPQNSQSGAYTLVAGDAGKHIYYTVTGQTVTIPANASVAFQIGTTITFITAPSVSLSIAITTDTMRLANTATTGTRTLAANGIATAVKTTATTWIISGNGLS